MRKVAMISVLCAAFLTQPANAACRLALALGLDVSGSVDDAEYKLQIQGLSAALLDLGVQEAILAMPEAWVDLFVYEWSGPGTQRTILPWTTLPDVASIEAAANRVLSYRSGPRQLGTALGRALEYGGKALSQRPDCWKHTLDISGDGENNTGPRPRDVRNAGMVRNVVVNALVIGTGRSSAEAPSNSDMATLTAYFRAEVIQGTDAFIETALGFDDFQNAMTRKLLKELETLAVGSLARPEDRL